MSWQEEAQAEMWDEIAANDPGRQEPRPAAPVLEPFDVHEGGQLRIGAAGDQLEVLELGDDRIPASGGPALTSPALEELAGGEV